MRACVYACMQVRRYSCMDRLTPLKVRLLILRLNEALQVPLVRGREALDVLL